MRNFAFCDGQLMAISQNDTLFSLLGTTYGGDGQSTFGLPDLRSRLPVGQGQGSGLTSRVIGQAAGVETVTLNSNQLPAHVHAAACNSTAADSSTPAGNFWASNANTSVAQYSATSDNGMNPLNLSSTGSNVPHANIMPYLTVNFVIALYGVYPSQN